MGEIIHHLAVFTKQQNRVLQNFFPICCRQILLNLCPVTEKGNINSRSNIPQGVIYALSDFLIMIVSWLVKQSLRAFLFQEVQP